MRLHSLPPSTIILASLLIIRLLTCLPCATAAQYESDKTGPPVRSQLTNTPAQQQAVIGEPSDHAAANKRIPLVGKPFNPLGDLRNALDVMQSTWFEVWIGTWPTAIDWTRAVIDTHLVAACGSFSKALLQLQARQDRSHYDANDLENDIGKYFAQNIAYYFGENAFSLRHQAYDDMLWVVLGWLESIKFIKGHSDRHYRFNPREPIPGKGRPWQGEQFIPAFAHRARIFWEITTQGWDTNLCDGGMVWNPRLGPYKNAITNELFIAASVGMYLNFPGDNNTAPYIADDEWRRDDEPLQPFDPKFLQAAVDGYHWLKNVGMTNKKGLYVDGFHIRDWKTNGTTCNIRNEMVYTYNQGVILSGLRDLWESTGNLSYLEDAHELVGNVIRATGWDLDAAKASDVDGWAGLGRHGILEDRCNAHGNCRQDNEMFKGIFMHHLSLLCEPLPLTSRVPGKTFGAGPDLVFLHAQSCKQYLPWVDHNARAALGTRDDRGRFGVWWGARSNGAGEDSLPEGAVDYRNDPLELKKDIWLGDDENINIAHDIDEDSEHLYQAYWRIPPIPDRDAFETAFNGASNKGDLNDRGRGRTVETQTGGVAVLRALWELQDNLK